MTAAIPQVPVPTLLFPIVADAVCHVLEASLGDEAEPPCRVALALQLIALAVSHLLALALAKLAQHLNVNTVFPEFLFHRQWLFGCKVTKIPTKAFIARQKMLS